LTFGAPALHLKARERWIGWSPRQRARRLGLVVNNSRFLVLPERQPYPNLALRVLGLGLRRSGADWQQQWGHPVLVVESFVDESRYRDTWYRACGFEAVGVTKGFGRASRDVYQEHGQPTQLYLRELRPGARKLLRQARTPGHGTTWRSFCGKIGRCGSNAPPVPLIGASFQFNSARPGVNLAAR
jgi:hypothetical protein